jgi:hypothetical protein
MYKQALRGREEVLRLTYTLTLNLVLYFSILYAN